MKKKRLLSLAMAAAMIFGSAAMLPEGAFDNSTGITASAEGETSGQCGDDIDWSLDNGVLTISGTGPMYDSPFYNRTDITSVKIESGVTSIGSDAFYRCESLTSITIPNSVTSIGANSFHGCTSLVSVTIPDSVESIGSTSFYGCTSLTSITIPNSVTSIGYSAFTYCTSLTSVTIPSSVTSIDYDAFSRCSSLTSITIPNSVTSISDYAFEGCTSLVSVTIPSSVTSIGAYSFMGCTSLVSVTIPGSVESIGCDAFSGCESLTSITIPSSVTSIDAHSFDGCTSLVSVTIPASVESIGRDAFYRCESLTSITIPNSVSSIDDGAFSFCEKLKSVTIPSSVTTIGERALGYYYLDRVEGFTIRCYKDTAGEQYAINNEFNYELLPDTEYHAAAQPTCTKDGNIEYWTYEGNYYSNPEASQRINEDDTVIKATGHKFGDWEQITAPTCTEKGAETRKCENCSETETRNIAATGHKFSNWEQKTPPTCTEKGVETRKCEYCSESETRDIAAKGHKFGYWITISTNGGTITQERTCTVCQQKETQTGLIGGQRYSDFKFNDNGDGTATLVEYVGVNENVAVPAITSDGKKVTKIGRYAFAQNEYIRSVTIPHGVTSIDESAFEATYLTSVVIPDTVTDIGSKAFYNSQLENVDIPDSVTNIGAYAFGDTSGLLFDIMTPWLINQLKKDPFVIVNGILIFTTNNSGTVVIPDTVKKIADNAFYGRYNYNLTGVKLPNGLTSIGDHAFETCSELTSIVFPDSITTIGAGAFKNSGIRSIDLPNSVKYIGDEAFSECLVESVTISGKDTVIGNKAFYNCWVLTDLSISEGVKSIGDEAFANSFNSSNERERKITIPGSVTSIGYRAFADCGLLQEVTIKDGVASIGAEAFSNCTNLWSVTIPKSVTQIGKNAFDKGDDEHYVTLKVYKGTAGEKYAKNNGINYELIDEYTRLAGSGRYETAAKISQAAFVDKADTVVLAYGLNYADALAGVSLATKLKAPILLTNTKSLDGTTLAEIKRLKAKKVIILGGTGAISTAVENSLKKEGLTTDRIFGASRFGTATAIAEKLNDAPTDVFFVYAFNSADALSVSPIAACKNAPIIYLSTKGDLHPDTAAYLAKLKKAGCVKNAYVIGGEGVISDDMATKAAKALGLSKATRIAGANRFATCVAVNEKFADVLNGDMICVATGMDFPDALAGGVYAAINKAPLFLINGKLKTPKLTDEQKEYLKTKAAAKITAFGGTGVVPDNHIADIAKNSI